jgi:hypothetical protein
LFFPKNAVCLKIPALKIAKLEMTTPPCKQSGVFVYDGQTPRCNTI